MSQVYDLDLFVLPIHGLYEITDCGLPAAPPEDSMSSFKVHYRIKSIRRAPKCFSWQVLEAESADDARDMFVAMDSDFRFIVTHVEQVKE